METLYDRYPVLWREKDSIENAIQLLSTAFQSGGKLLLCGNGGSAADCDHIVGELAKGFLKKRPLRPAIKEKFARIGQENLATYLQEGLPVISLTGGGALPTAFSNDVHADYIFAQQVMCLGKEGDVLLAISTSGNSMNVQRAVVTAKVKGMKTIGLTGKHGGWLAENTDVAIRVPEEETYKIQELHLPVYHWICARIEQNFFEE